MIHDKLGDRMKAYESVAQYKLTRRTPVIIRLDMKCGHSFTKGLTKPWDNIFRKTMDNTMIKLFQNIQCCQFSYTQSDEISLFLRDWDTLETDAWFDNKVQKLTSVVASMATLYFNQEFRRLAEEEFFIYRTSVTPQSVELQQKVNKYHDTLRKCIQQGAMFDARCFNLPKEEVVNYFYWRQVDAMRNSINSYGQANFSHKELQGKSTKEIKEMLLAKGIDWDNLSCAQRYGSCCYRFNKGLCLDHNMPLLKDDGRNLLENLVMID